MTRTIASQSPLLADLATILARGYLRLTSTAPLSATSGDKELELSAEESPHHVDQDRGQRCPRKLR